MYKRLRETREDHDETQEFLAKSLGYHRVHIARIEAGSSEPSANYIKQFCKHYQISADYILELGSSSMIYEGHHAKPQE